MLVGCILVHLNYFYLTCLIRFANLIPSLQCAFRSHDNPNGNVFICDEVNRDANSRRPSKTRFSVNYNREKLIVFFIIKRFYYKTNKFDISIYIFIYTLVFKRTKMFKNKKRASYWLTTWHGMQMRWKLEEKVSRKD